MIAMRLTERFCLVEDHKTCQPPTPTNGVLLDLTSDGHYDVPTYGLTGFPRRYENLHEGSIAEPSDGHLTWANIAIRTSEQTKHHQVMCAVHLLLHLWILLELRHYWCRLSATALHQFLI